MDTGNEIKRARIHGRIAVAAVFLLLVCLLYFVAGLPLWASTLIALAACVVNSFVLRIEDSSSSR
jgi:putative flippase GtrA